MQNMTDNHDHSESLPKKKAVHNAFFKVKSDVKVGFELTASIDFNEVAQSAKNMVNSVKSTFSDGS